LAVLLSLPGQQVAKDATDPVISPQPIANPKNGNRTSIMQQRRFRYDASGSRLCTTRVQYRRLRDDVSDSRLYPEGLKFSPSASLGAF